MKKVLFVAVHPDDETLGAGGTILKYINNGDDVFWLIITRANPKITTLKNIEKVQLSYIKEVAHEYGFSGWKQLNFLTTELDRYSISELIKEISSYISEIKPEILYLNHHSDVHSDHRMVFDAVFSCTKSFRYPFIKKILIYETLSETEFAPATSANLFVPNVYSDISDYMERKLVIMKLFSTEQMDEPLPRAMSTIKALARYRGSRIGVEYAEAFQLLYCVE